MVLGGAPQRLLRFRSDAAPSVARVLGGTPTAADRSVLAHLLRVGAVSPVWSSGAGDGRLASVEVVIPVLNDRSGVARLIGELGDAVAVCVVDDGSEPPLQPASTTRWIRSGCNGGPAAARNLGWRTSEADIVVFVDADVAFGRGPEADGNAGAAASLGQLLAHFDDPGVVAVAPRIRGAAGPTAAPSQLRRYERANSPLDLGDEPGLVHPGTRLSYVPGAVLAVRRSALAEVDGFEETLRFGEDVDLVWRLVGRGGLVRYEPGVELAHRPRASWRAWVAQRIGYGSSAAPLSDRHPGRLAPVVVSPEIAVALLAMLRGRRSGVALGGVALALRVARTSRQLAGGQRQVRGPEVSQAVQLTGLGCRWAIVATARAARRVWWPLALVGWVAWPRSGGAASKAKPVRGLVAAAFVAPLAASWKRPISGVIAVADDLGYSVGVWRGVVVNRKAGPLLPRIHR